MAGFFGMFDYTKPGKGVSKEDVDKHGPALFFDILGRRWGKLMLLNILYVIFSIPAFVINWGVSGFLLTWIIGMLGGMENVAAIIGIKAEDISMMFQLLNLFFSVSLILLLGSGSASAATGYVIRKYVNDTHAWVWSDFWDSFKGNFLQGTVCYIINLLVFSLCVVAIIFYNTFIGGILGTALSAIVGVILLVFLMMQMYVYPIMASFKLKIKDIYRNALLLTIGRLPVNFVAALLTAGVIYLYSIGVVYALSIIAVIVLMYTFTLYIQQFIINNTINKYLLTPSEEASGQNNRRAPRSEEDEIFSDELKVKKNSEED